MPQRLHTLFGAIKVTNHGFEMVPVSKMRSMDLLVNILPSEGQTRVKCHKGAITFQDNESELRTCRIRSF